MKQILCCTVFAFTVLACAVLPQSATDTAFTVVDTACTLGLVQSGAVQAEAELEGVPVQWLAEQLCATPAVYQAWQDAQKTRNVDPGRAALAVARARGLVR